MAELLRFRDDEPVDHPAVTVDAFLDQSNAAAVRIEPGDDARALIPHLDHVRLVEVNFPAFTDGRGYSAARVLREAAGALLHRAKRAGGGEGLRSPGQAGGARVARVVLRVARQLPPAHASGGLSRS